MLKTVKIIRKLHNAKILFISSDEKMKKMVENEFDDYFQELDLISDNSQAVSTARDKKYDLVIIDTNTMESSFSEICTDLSTMVPNLSKIVVTDSENKDYLVTSINNNVYTVLSKPFKLEDLKLSIIMCINQTKRGDKIDFQNGVYFDEYRDQFFGGGGVLINFTRLEKAFIKLLIDRRGEITDYETIRNVVWKGKDMSIYTMRNIVNKIRQKTYYEIIKNQSNKGYIVDCDPK